MTSVALPAFSVATPERADGLWKRTISWVDRKSSPEDDTHGDLASPAYLQAAVGAGLEGLALMGWSGALGSSAASLAGVAVEEWTGSGSLAVATGAVVGATMCSLPAVAGGLPVFMQKAVCGALLGVFQTLGSGKVAAVRDASDGGAMLAGVMMRGPAKVAAGIASALSMRLVEGQHPGREAALAAALGVGIGVGLSAVGMGSMSLAGAGLMCGAAAGGGVLVGPRYAQMVRNLGKDAGTAIEHQMRGARVLHGPLTPAVRNSLGAVPAALASEAAKGLLYADGDPTGMLLGALSAAIQLVETYAKAAPCPITPRGAAKLQRAKAAMSPGLQPGQSEE